MGDASSSRRCVAQGRGYKATSSRRRRHPQRLHSAHAGRNPIVGPRRWRRPRRLHSARAGRSPIVGPRSLLVDRAGSCPATARSFGSIRRIIIAVKSNS